MSTPFVSAKGIEMIGKKIESTEYRRKGKKPKILIISPIFIRNNVVSKWTSAEFNIKSVDMVAMLGKEYKKVTEEKGWYFLNAAEIADASPLDAVHMDAPNHKKLACSIFEKVINIYQ